MSQPRAEYLLNSLQGLEELLTPYVIHISKGEDTGKTGSL